jgi:hypothetical protein
MRDFRDAKAMAQTLRDALKPKTAISQSESLELIAKVFGFQNWNVLAAAIQSDGDSSPRPDVVEADASEPQEIILNPAILDRYVGFYELAGRGVMTITRDGDQLVSRLTGQRGVPLFARSDVRFFAKLVDAQISFRMDASGIATALVLHQGGRDTEMNRIDATVARQIEAFVSERLQSQSPSYGSEPALRRMIAGLRSGQPNYEEMDAPLAEATRQQLPLLHEDLREAGSVQSISFVGVGNGGVDVYGVQHERQMLYWRIGLDSHGTISTAWVSPGL